MQLPAEELRILIAQGEGRELEFKRGLPRPEKIARTLCAFANTRGGLLLVGVLDRGQLFGEAKPQRTIKSLQNTAAQLSQPALLIDIQLIELDGKTILACHVPLSPRRPHAVHAHGQDPETVVRVGSSNRAADGPTLRSLRNRPSRRAPRDELEERILAYVDESLNDERLPGGQATIAGFASANNFGLQRTRRAFVKLESDGLLIAHGFGKGRFYGRP